jgi:hypothetical protein
MQTQLCMATTRSSATKRSHVMCRVNQPRARGTHWDDSKRRHDFFAEAGIRFLDLGTSGGVSGARRGAARPGTSWS